MNLVDALSDVGLLRDDDPLRMWEIHINCADRYSSGTPKTFCVVQLVSSCSVDEVKLPAVPRGSMDQERLSPMTPSRRTMLKTLGVSAVTPATAARTTPAQGSPCLEIFRDYVTRDPQTFRELYEIYAEAAKDFERIATLAEGLNITIEGYEAVVHTHYGDTQEGRSEFLDALEKSTAKIARETEDPLFDELHWYTARANYIYESVYDRSDIIQEYARTVEKAYELTQGSDYESIGAALRLGVDIRTGQVEDDFIHIALEGATRPFEDAVVGLEILTRQLLLSQTYVESQLPILEELERLAAKRNQGTISNREMYSYLIGLTEVVAGRARVAHQIYQLQQIGIGESSIFGAAQEIRKWINDTFGYWSGRSFRELAEDAQSNYESAATSLARFHNEMQQYDDCRVDRPPDSVDDETDSGEEPTGEAAVAVAIRETNAPLDAGEFFQLTAAVQNNGGTEITETIRLIVGHTPEEVDSQTITLPPGDTQMVTLGYETYPAQQTTEFPVRVESEDDTAEQTITVYGAEDRGESGGGPPVAVTIQETNAPLNAGDYFQLTVTVQNTGTRETTEEIRLIVGHTPEQVDSQTVTLSPGDTQTVTLGYETYPAKQTTEFPVRVESNDDADVEAILVYGTG